MSKPGRHPEILLDWRPTALPDAVDDFIARIDAGTYCRIHRRTGGPQDGRWYWAAASGGYNAGTGYEETAEAAAVEAERAMRAGPLKHRKAST